MEKKTKIDRIVLISYYDYLTAYYDTDWSLSNGYGNKD